MPDDATLDNENSAANAAAQIDWDSPDNPYLKRFTDTQSAYTQNQQELARLKALEEDQNAYFEVGKRNGWIEFEEQQAQQQQGDETFAQYQQRLEAAEARLAEHDARIAAENAAAGEELFHQDLDTWAEAEGVKLSKADHNAIFGLLMKAPDPTQESAARAVFEAHVAEKKAEREALEAEIRESLKRPRVPHVPTNGQTGTDAPDWSQMSPGEINAYLAEKVRGSTAQT